MAKKTKTTATAAEADTDEIDPDAMYSVELTRAIKIGPTWVRPGSERVHFLGSTVIEHADAIKSKKRV